MKCTDNTARQLLWLLSPEQQHTVTGFLVSCAAKLPELPAPYPPLNSFNVHCKRTFSLRILTVHTVLVHLQPFSLHLLATSLFFLFRIPIPSVLVTIYPFPLCIFYILKIINLLLVISTRCFFFFLSFLTSYAVHASHSWCRGLRVCGGEKRGWIADVCHSHLVHLTELDVCITGSCGHLGWQYQGSRCTCHIFVGCFVTSTFVVKETTCWRTCTSGFCVELTIVIKCELPFSTGFWDVVCLKCRQVRGTGLCRR